MVFFNKILFYKVSQLREHKKLPVYIVEYHNDVMQFYLRNIGSKHLSISGNTLIHFDSHPDLQIPTDLNADTITANPKSLNDSLTIGDWILPACYYGIFNKIIWLKMFWAQQLPDGHFKMALGKNKKDNTLKVNFEHNYFAAANWFENNLDNLDHIKWIQLSIQTVNFNDHFNWFESFSFSNSNYVLDIDLDFFSTDNPFEHIYEKANVYQLLKKIYKFDSVEKDLKIFGYKYQTQIDFLKKIFETLSKTGELVIEDANNEILSKEQIGLLKCLKSEIEDNYLNDKDIDWNLIHVAGTTCSDNELDSLPKHITSRDDILLILEVFGRFLNKLESVPRLVSVSRSSLDDYTPKKDVDFIQNSVLKCLRDKWLIDDPVLFYLDSL